MIAIFSDALNVELIDLLKDTLTGIKYDKHEINTKLAELAKFILNWQGRLRMLGNG